MNKKTIIQLIITAILIVILLFSIANTIDKLNKTKELQRKDLQARLSAQQEEQGSLSNQAVVISNGESIYKKLLQDDTVSNSLRDPFLYQAVNQEIVESVPEIKLTAILWNHEQTMAVINHKLVKVGDQLGVNRVVDIKENKVILNDGFKDFELKLKNK